MPTKTSKTPAPLRVLITGASTGIGYAAALRLGSKGHHVALVARRKELLEDLGLVDTPMAEVFAARGQKGIAPEAVAKAIEKLIARPRANIFIPRYVEGVALARRFAPRSFRRGIEVYGRLQKR